MLHKVLNQLKNYFMRTNILPAIGIMLIYAAMFSIMCLMLYNCFYSAITVLTGQLQLQIQYQY